MVVQLGGGQRLEPAQRGLAYAGNVLTDLNQHLRRDPRAVPDQRQQHVLGQDVVVAQLEGLAQREFQHLLGPRRERHVPLGRRGTAADALADRIPRPVERDAERPLADEPEQQMLGADDVVIEHPGLFLSQDDDPLGTLGEPFEHDTHVLAARPHAPRPTDA